MKSITTCAVLALAILLHSCIKEDPFLRGDVTGTWILACMQPDSIEVMDTLSGTVVLLPDTMRWADTFVVKEGTPHVLLVNGRPFSGSYPPEDYIFTISNGAWTENLRFKPKVDSVYYKLFWEFPGVTTPAITCEGVRSQ